MGQNLLTNQSFIQYLVEFHVTRDFFECHEIMEEHWKASPNNEFSNLWVAFIQIAVAQYHDRRKNKRGAELMYTSAYNKFLNYRDNVTDVDLQQLCNDISKRLQQLFEPYYDLNIIIRNKQLLHNYHKAVLEHHRKRGSATFHISNDVINRHKTRDRSDIILAREAALKLKHKQKKQ